MGRHPFRIGLAITAIAAIAAVVLLSGDKGGEAAAPAAAGSPQRTLDWLTDLLTPASAAPPAKDPSFKIARLLPGPKVALRSAPAPAGRVVAMLGPMTEFGSPRTFHVAESRDGWLGVVATQVPNGRLGWIREDPARVDTYETTISVVADLSLRAVTVRYGKKVIDRLPVTIGAAGTSTPEGTFSVTDGLAGTKLGPYYGCCVLALSGHQPNPPPGWIGGDRIAIHGTPGTVGAAASGGCLRVTDHDMVALFALVPLGAPVFIHA
ncbi:MAG: L,D-transpeptidase [Solirubrobacterales bacterium]